MKNIVLPFAMDDELSNEIIQFAKKSNKSFWKANCTDDTRNRFFCKISDYTYLDLSKKIEEFKVKLYNLLGIFDFKNEHIFGNFIGVNCEGGQVHIHTDPPLENWYHTRINFLVQKPLKGGLPLIDNVKYDIEEGECWFNNATLWEHGSTVVEGETERIVLSLGAYISPVDFNNVQTNFLKKN